MKNSIPLAVIIGVVFLALSISVRDATAQNVLGEILRRMDAHNNSLQSLRSALVMVNRQEQIRTTDKKVGSISFIKKTSKRGMYMRIDWITENDKPKEETISVADGAYQMYQKGANLVFVGKSDGKQKNPSLNDALTLMSMSRDQLKASYNLVYLGEEKISDGTKTWHLELTPKAAVSYKTAELWVDVDGMPRQVKRIEKNSDWTAIQLSNIQKNLTFKLDLFKPKYPKEVKRVPS